MAKETYSASEAARALGVSIDTIRRWERGGKMGAERDGANRRIFPASEVERLRGEDGRGISARNRLRGVIREVQIDGLLAQVEIDVTEPARVVALITRDSAEELGLRTGDMVSGVVKATSVMIER